MDYKIVEFENTPLEVQEWINENINSENQKIINAEEMTYVIITRGIKNTGGYDVEAKLTEEENFIKLSLENIDPKEDEAVIQVITNPYIIIKFKKTNKEILIENSNEL